MRLTHTTISILAAIFVALFSGSNGKTASVRDADGELTLPEARRSPDGRTHHLIGKASYYADRFNGRKTASGDIYDGTLMTAAHRTLPFGTMVRVIDPANNRSVVVRINDRGPYSKHKVIDLSRAAAEDLKMITRGTLPVHLAVIEWGGVE